MRRKYCAKKAVIECVNNDMCFFPLTTKGFLQPRNKFLYLMPA